METNLEAVDNLDEVRVEPVFPSPAAWLRRTRETRELHPSHRFGERRADDNVGVVGQISLVTSPKSPLPPFGRREGDIRSVPRLEKRLQRALDVVVAASVLLITSVPCLLIAIAIKLTSRGPVLFVQERIGRHGKPFRIIKFRTMRTGAAAEVTESSALRERYIENSFKLDADDPRITALGRVLRRTSLDELPQLLNVLRGDMSIVGIRPLLAEEHLERPQIDRELYNRFRPGLTGLWQISGRSSVVHNQRVVLDRAYAAEWSVRSNVSILARTPATLLPSEESAY